MKFKGRTNSRIMAMMVLYNYDMNKTLDLENLSDLIESDNYLEKMKDDQNVYELDYDKDYLEKLVRGTIEKLDYLDYVISLSTENYTLEALSFVDRSILRIGAYEMIYLRTPKEIVINEMINISKVYSEISGFNSSKFDNAILDKIAKGNFKDE